MSHAPPLPRAAFPPESVPPTPERSRVGMVLALVLGVGALSVVLAGVGSELFDLERHTVPKELVLHATALLCLLVMAPGWRRVELGAVGAALAAFVAWSALSALFATNHWLALYGFGVSFSGLVIFAAAARAARDGAGTLVLAGLGIAATVGAGLGAAQAYGMDAAWLADSRPPGATFGNRNFLAHLVAIAVPVLIFLVARARRGIGAVPWLIALAVAAVVIVLTRSRAAWLALGFAMATMTVAAWLRGVPRSSDTRSGRLLAALVVAGAATAAAIVLPNELRWRSDAPYAETLTRIADFREGSGRGRLIQYRNSLDLVVADPLLGTGPGNWFVHYPLVTSPGDPSFAGNDPIPTNPWPSSDWVTMLVERGPIGALLLALAGVAAALVALRRLRSDERGVSRRSVAALGVLAAALVAGLFDAVLLLAAPLLFVAAALGALLPPTAPVVSRPLATRGLRIARFAAVALAAFLTIVAAGRVAAILITAEDTGRTAIERALRFDPGSHRLHLQLARRGGCSVSLPHARAASRLMPFHDAPRQGLTRCGE